MMCGDRRIGITQSCIAKMGRVLITSRVMNVGRHVNPSRDPHTMRLLTGDESIELLLLECGREKGLPQELVGDGRLIASECRGHHLAIVLIGGILAQDTYSRYQETWRRVSTSLSYIIDDDDDEPMERMAKIIALIYEELPYHLRECFVYFGMFPEDFEISIWKWKLIRLWIAEGFIHQKLNFSLEETAESYLQELIDRKLVKNVKCKITSHDVKACRVHDLILDLCIAQAARDGSFQQIKMSYDGGFQPPANEELKFRRLCIHSNALNFVSRKPNGPNVRSFICSSGEEMAMPMKDLSTIPKGFKLLRVLDVEPINFKFKLPRDLFQLLHSFEVLVPICKG